MEAFKYPDTNSTRAKIDFINRKFKNQKIAIIGMGGTGSYILDLVSKTPVSEIHIYDGDIFQLHNAFRAPGTISGEKLDKTENLTKVQYYSDIYSHMHNGIVPHNEYITEDNIDKLLGFDFAFISVDSNKARINIINQLIKIGVSFIDVGLGVNRVEDALIGTLRITTGSERKNNHIENRIGQDDSNENEYSTNIQIADLNCLNASLAVIKWKKIIGFYQDLKNEHHSLFFINTNKIINDDFTA